MTTTPRRVADVVSEGAERFWSAVAEAYPDVETGDFPPGDTLRLERALTEAVEQWLLYNHPPTRDEADGPWCPTRCTGVRTDPYGAACGAPCVGLLHHAGLHRCEAHKAAGA